MSSSEISVAMMKQVSGSGASPSPAGAAGAAAASPGQARDRDRDRDPAASLLQTGSAAVALHGTLVLTDRAAYLVAGRNEVFDAMLALVHDEPVAYLEFGVFDDVDRVPCRGVAATWSSCSPAASAGFVRRPRRAA
jgi:hypothetical protein